MVELSRDSRSGVEGILDSHLKSMKLGAGNYSAGRRTYPQTRISGGSSLLMPSTISLIPGTFTIIFIDTRLPAACTPVSVRAARPRLTFEGVLQYQSEKMHSIPYFEWIV